jgi:hypothetical protein
MAEGTDKPTTFVVHLKPTANCRDPIKSLRAVLKRSLRDWDLRCTTIATTNGDRIAHGEQS